MPDNLTREQRSYCMSRVKGKNTTPERLIRSILHKRGYRFRKHVKNLPGCPDIVFPACRVAVFIDGDFWHGYRFKTWSSKLSPFWKTKISKNIDRDRRNFGKLKRLGWKPVRIWVHSIKKNPDAAARKIASLLE